MIVSNITKEKPMKIGTIKSSARIDLGKLVVKVVVALALPQESI